MSSIPSEWRFDSKSTAGAVVRVVALSGGDAAQLPDAKDQVLKLYEALFAKAGHPVPRAKPAVERAFVESTDPSQPSRTVLVYVDAAHDEPSDRVAAFTRVVYDGERIVIGSNAFDSSLEEAVLREVTEAIISATEDVANHITRDQFALHKGTYVPSMMIWRGQLGASDSLKQQFETVGYDMGLTDRLEMTAFLKDIDPTAAINVAEGIDVRALDFDKDDLLAVYQTVKCAYGPNPPSFAAWKQHYLQHPRFAADMSYAAWKGDTPLAVALIELVTESEGGGEEEVDRVYKLSAQLSEDPEQANTSAPLVFTDDYETRKTAIRSITKTGYVCGVGTLPEHRGKGLAQSVLRHCFRAAKIAGLEIVYLGTDRQNPAAVRAYVRAGMIETKAENHGMITAKIVSPQP